MHGKDTYTKWRHIYSKYLKQTHILLKKITKQWQEYKQYSNYSDLKQTLKYFEQNSSLYLNSTQLTTKQQKQQNLNKKSPKKQKQQLNLNDLQQMQNINELFKVRRLFLLC